MKASHTATSVPVAHDPFVPLRLQFSTQVDVEGRMWLVYLNSKKEEKKACTQKKTNEAQNSLKRTLVFNRTLDLYSTLPRVCLSFGYHSL